MLGRKGLLHVPSGPRHVPQLRISLQRAEEANRDLAAAPGHDHELSAPAGVPLSATRSSMCSEASPRPLLQAEPWFPRSSVLLPHGCGALSAVLAPRSLARERLC